MAEGMCRDLLVRENKPFNTQGITDCLAQFGVKKGQAQKALDNLVTAADGIICKEFGKIKLYFASQAEIQTASPEEMESKQQLHATLVQQNNERVDAVKRITAENSSLKGSMTTQQVEERTQQLQSQVATDEAKLNSLQSGTDLVSDADRTQVEQLFTDNLGHWRKRRRVFKDIWDTVSESINRPKEALFEELGIEADDGDLFSKQQLLEPKSNKRRCY